MFEVYTGLVAEGLAGCIACAIVAAWLTFGPVALVTLVALTIRSHVRDTRAARVRDARYAALSAEFYAAEKAARLARAAV